MQRQVAWPNCFTDLAQMFESECKILQLKLPKYSVWDPERGSASQPPMSLNVLAFMQQFRVTKHIEPTALLQQLAELTRRTAV